MGLEQSKQIGRSSHRVRTDVNSGTGKYGKRSCSSRQRHIEYISHGNPARNPHATRNRSLDHRRGSQIHVHFYSFGALKGRPAIELPVLYAIDLSHAIMPPRSLCRLFTGQDPEIIEDFWSHSLNRRLYHDVVFDIGHDLLDLAWDGRGAHVAVLVNCASGVRKILFYRHFPLEPSFKILRRPSGAYISSKQNHQSNALQVHRSVVFMSRLYAEFEKWPGIQVSKTHCHLRAAIEKRKAHSVAQSPSRRYK